ncbi:FAD-dependent oxidoreductase [Pseudomonas mandelii]|uniref:FAD-dependent oxidoreductase n=1 Tax=Pseudomonas mandelii TaxID=75612 RepID=UPI0003A9D62E|nr:FAD-dependent oxidoreductase [Pseudomonas mandelii]
MIGFEPFFNSNLSYACHRVGENIVSGCSESRFDVVIVGSCLTSACCAYFLAEAGLKVARLKLSRVRHANLPRQVSSWVGLQPAGVMLDLSRMGLKAFRLLSKVVDPSMILRTPNVLAATTTGSAETLLAFTERRVLEGVVPVFYDSEQLKEFHPCVEEAAVSACCFFEEVQVDLTTLQLGIEHALNRFGVVTAAADDLKISKERSKPYAIVADHGGFRSDKVVVVDWKPCNPRGQEKEPHLSATGMSAGYPGSSGLTALTVPQALEVYEGLQATAELANSFSSNRSIWSSAFDALFRRNGQRNTMAPPDWEVPYCGFYPGDKGVVVVGGG